MSPLQLNPTSAGQETQLQYKRALAFIGAVSCIAPTQEIIGLSPLERDN